MLLKELRQVELQQLCRTLDMQGRIGRQSKRSISAKLVANLITVAGADRVLTMDLHTTVTGFYIPVDHLLGVPILAEYFKEKFSGLDDFAIVSRCRKCKQSEKLAERLDAPIAIVDKRRPKANVSEL